MENRTKKAIKTYGLAEKESLMRMKQSFAYRRAKNSKIARTMSNKSIVL
jgi:hypothetical protein